MCFFGTLIGVIAVLVWSYLFLLRGRFWQLQQSPGTSDGKPSRQPRIAVVVPARNEAESIAECTSSLLQSDGPRVHVFLLDDGSTDGTADLARNAAAKLGCIDQLTVLNSGNLPANWSGKLWAVNQAVIAARTFNPDFLLFTDADIRHDTAAIATLVSVAEQGNYDLTSFMVRLHCSSLAERLLIPAFVFFFSNCIRRGGSRPPAGVRRGRRGDACWCGQKRWRGPGGLGQ